MRVDVSIFSKAFGVELVDEEPRDRLPVLGTVFVSFLPVYGTSQSGVFGKFCRWERQENKDFDAVAKTGLKYVAKTGVRCGKNGTKKKKNLLKQTSEPMKRLLA